eukprot:3346941-Pyramimonas_sp.AAC.1
MKPRSTEPDADRSPTCHTTSLNQMPTSTTTTWATEAHHQTDPSQQTLYNSSASQPTYQHGGSVFAPTSRRCRQRGCGSL